MKTLVPYLTFAGRTREAFNFYKDVLKGEIVSIQTFAEAKMETAEAHKNNIIHAEFKADGVHLMASDGMPGFVEQPGNNVSLSIELSDADEQSRIFEAFSKGGKVDMPLQDTFWGARYGMVTDRYGIHWMLNCQKN